MLALAIVRRTRKPRNDLLPASRRHVKRRIVVEEEKVEKKELRTRKTSSVSPAAAAVARQVG